jgi:hypothetical protein
MFGELGRYTEEPITPAQDFQLGLEPEEVQSRHAIATGAGWVRSRFIVPPAAPEGRPVRIDIVTALWPGQRSETLATVGYAT